jgi:hypothetical protein
MLAVLFGAAAMCGLSAHAQNFGSAMQRDKIVLTRKLPPTGHIDGSTIRVTVSGSAVPPDLSANLKSTLESVLINNDSRLRTADGPRADATIDLRVTTYTQPPPQTDQEQVFALGKKGLQNQPMTHVTGMMTTVFQAQDARAGKSIAAATVNLKFDHEYPVPPPPAKTGMGGMLSHLPNMPVSVSSITQPGAKPQQGEEKPPTPAELRDKLVQETAFDIASRMVNTTEEVPVMLARGPGLDDANRLMEQKLWTRALEQLETMKPFDRPEDDAYRLYELGVVNEALAYQAEDIPKARKYLEEAAIDYGKAIDAKQAEKYFLEPQTRIDTALAHYKVLGDRAIAASAAASAAPAAASDAMTNDDVIAMVAAKLDEANILDTIQHAGAVKFDVSPRGQIDLSKAGVNGRIITAMKDKARAQQ